MSKKHIMNAGICCICTAVIFGLHFFVYGRMLLDNPVLVGATCAVFIASAAGRTGEEREPWFPPNHIVTRLCQLIWCAALCTIPYVLYIEPYSLDNWIILPLWIAVTVMELNHQEKNPTAYTVSMVAVLCIAGAFLLIVHPTTVQQAQNMVEQAGYTDLYRFKVEFNGTFWDTLPDGTGIGCTMPEEKDPLGYYGFRACKGNEKYCVIVSAARGQIEVQEKQGV